MSSTTTVSNSSDDEPSPAQQQQQDEQELLSEVNAALHRIVSTPSDLDALPDEIGSQDGGGAHVTLSDEQLTSLRKLERRIRSSLAQQQRRADRAKASFRRVITGDENRRVRDAARSSVQRTSVVVKKRVRKAVTGSSERPLREWAKDKKVVKTVDKFSFVLGVFVLCATEFMVLQYPQHFGIYYVVLVSVMLALRLYMYARMKLEYFLLDFCYQANIACFVSVLLLPDNARLWRLNFAVSNGTLLGALLAWRNSLVFHSLDKVTSIAIHLLPGLLTYIERWSDGTIMCPDSESCSMQGSLYAILDCVLFYAVWQLLYILKTEIIDRERFLADPSIQTSLRWLTRDTKNTMHRAAKRVCRAIGVLGQDEDFDPEALKTKLVFWIGQFLFTFVTLLPTPFLFANYAANTAYIILVLSLAVYNGSNYYFEVFAARYIQQLEAASKKREETTTQSDEKRNENGGIKEE